MGEVPAIKIEHLSEAQRRAFMLADNRLTEIAVWDDRLLAEQLKELAELDLSFDIEATGFEVAEIDLRIASLSQAGAAAPTTKSHCRSYRARRSVESAIFGLLGSHRLLCGDATDPAAYAELMESEKAAVVVHRPAL